MADNVDLMVVGTNDGLTADELTKRLVAEFNQPADAFNELVAAACHGEPAYAAQTAVSLDTAVEGQMQLENLGVVCQLFMDGQEIGGAALTPAASNDAQPIVQVQDSDLPDEYTDHEPETAKLEGADSAADIGGEGISDEDDISGLDEDLEADGTIVENVGSTEADEPDIDSDAEGAEFDFLDELGSLDDELKRVADARETKPVNTNTEATASDKDHNSALQPDPASQGQEAPGDAEEMSAPEPDSEPEAKAPPAELLELTLADDDSQPLTKPKTKSNAVADDGGLTLSLDNETPLTAPKKQSTTTPAPSDGGLTLSIDDELQTDGSAIVAEEKSEKKEADPDAVAVQVSEKSGDSAELTAEDDSTAVQTVEARDTSRELQEEIKPLLDEPEPQKTDSDRETEATPKNEEQPVARPVNADEPPAAPEKSADENEPDATPATQTASASSIESLIDDLTSNTDGLVLTDEAPQEEPENEEQSAARPVNTDEAPTAPEQRADGSKNSETTAPQSSSTNSINSLIEDLASNTGGLVLPGQAPQEAPVEEVTEEPVTEAVAEEDNSASSVASIDGESNGVDHDSGIDSRLEDSDSLETLIDRERRVKLLKATTIATLAVGLLGGGAAFYFMGGAASKAPAPVVATAPVVTESSVLAAVEEVSLNAAIERSSDISNPHNYSTEELIVYLSEDLGDNARQELQNYVNGGAEPQLAAALAPVPRMGPAIPADSNSVLWLKNRVAHPADKYFDEWAKREVAVQAYMELQERLIEVGDLEIARGISATTRDRLFTVMSLQRLARSYSQLGHTDKSLDALDSAARSTFGIESEAERVIAIADFGFTEKSMGLEEDSLDTFLKASILARSLRKPESRTVALSAIAEYYDRVGRVEDTRDYLDLAMSTAYELPVNTAARDLAIRHVALTEVKLGLTEQATEHANLIVDPFAAVSALHGIALELERTGDQTNARLTLNMAYRAGSLIQDSEKREKLLEKIKLAGG